MRILAAILAAVLFAIIAWLAGRSYRGPVPRPTHVPAATLAATPTADVPQPSPSPLRHRLAGTVVGDVRYAVIEDPNGGNELYRPGQTVPNLGLLVEVDARAAVFESDGRRFELELKPAATPTPGPTPEPTEEDEITEPSPDSDRTPESDSSDSESSSSDEPGRPAS